MTSHALACSEYTCTTLHQSTHQSVLNTKYNVFTWCENTHQLLNVECACRLRTCNKIYEYPNLCINPFIYIILCENIHHSVLNTHKIYIEEKGITIWFFSDGTNVSIFLLTEYQILTETEVHLLFKDWNLNTSLCLNLI